MPRFASRRPSVHVDLVSALYAAGGGDDMIGRCGFRLMLADQSTPPSLTTFLRPTATAASSDPASSRALRPRRLNRSAAVSYTHSPHGLSVSRLSTNHAVCVQLRIQRLRGTGGSYWPQNFWANLLFPVYKKHTVHYVHLQQHTTTVLIHCSVILLNISGSATGSVYKR